MSAEILRRAAALMRERAEAATPGPWDVQPDEEGRPRSVRANAGMGPTPFRAVSLGYHETSANVAHIASWHPDVALAVAKAMDDVAQAWEISDGWVLDLDDDDVRFEDTVDGGWLTVARAYLGEQA